VDLLIAQFSPTSYHFRPKYSPQHPLLDHLILCYSLSIGNQVSHPYKKACEFICILYVLIFTFLTRISSMNILPENNKVIVLISVEWIFFSRAFSWCDVCLQKKLFHRETRGQEETVITPLRSTVLPTGLSDWHSMELLPCFWIFYFCRQLGSVPAQHSPVGGSTSFVSLLPHRFRMFEFCFQSKI
jgi:hypothetical protein